MDFEREATMYLARRLLREIDDNERRAQRLGPMTRINTSSLVSHEGEEKNFSQIDYTPLNTAFCTN